MPEGCQPCQEGVGLLAPHSCRVRGGTGCLSPPLEPENLANFSELRFGNDLNTENVFLEKMWAVYFRDYEFPARAKCAQRFPPRIAFQLLPHYFSSCFIHAPPPPAKNHFFSGQFGVMVLFLGCCSFFHSLAVPSMPCSTNSEHRHNHLFPFL